MPLPNDSADPVLPEHSHVEESIPEYVEGHLDPDEASRVRAHLDACESCSRFFHWVADQRAAILAANLRHLSDGAVLEIALVPVPTPSEAAHLAMCSACRDDVAGAPASSDDPPDPPPGEVLADYEIEPKRGPRFWLLAIAASATAFTLVVLVLLPQIRNRMAYPVASGRIVSVQAPPFGTLWEVSHTASIGPFERLPGTRSATLIYGLEGDGADGGLVVARDFISGKELWTSTPPYQEIAAIFGEDMAAHGAFNVNRFHYADLDGDRVPEVLVGRSHNTWFAASLAALGRDGARIGVYHNWGLIYKVVAADLDGDGKEEVVAAGTNNAKAYQGGTIFILDERHFGGAAVDSIVHPDCPVRDSSLVRVVIPQFDPPFMDLLRIDRLHIEGLVVTGVGDQARSHASVEAHEAPVILVFDRHLRPLSHALSDALRGVTRDWPAGDRARFLSDEFQDAWFSKIVRFEGDSRPAE